MISANCGTMLTTPRSGLLAAKNIQDHAAFNTSWTKNKVSAVRRIEPAGRHRIRQTENAIQAWEQNIGI